MGKLDNLYTNMSATYQADNINIRRFGPLYEPYFRIAKGFVQELFALQAYNFYKREKMRKKREENKY